MKLSEIGEFALIDRLAEMTDRAQGHLPPRRQMVIGIGDDAAAWPGDIATQLATVDSMIQDVHFSLDTIPWPDLGWKALAVNLSDIAAMGGEPGYALVSLALPGDTQVDDITALYRGMLDLAGPSGVAVVGGDTCSAPLVIITIAVLGRASNMGILTRSAARPGELVAVTGHPGTAAAGLEMLKDKLALDAGAASLLRDAFLRPQPRITEGQTLLECGVKAAIDISDGLTSDLGHICRQSRVGARIEVERLPIHPLVAASFGDQALELSLSGGEDYELLFTAPAKVMDRVRETASVPVTVIGEVTAENRGEVTLVNHRGNPVAPGRKGWEHFPPV